jgi:hypothetical protein
MGHASKRADRLLIRPASGRQAGTGLFARTYHWKDTRTRGHPYAESQTKSTDTNLTTTPDGAPTQSQSLRLMMAERESRFSPAPVFGMTPEQEALRF